MLLRDAVLVRGRLTLGIPVWLNKYPVMLLASRKASIAVAFAGWCTNMKAQAESVTHKQSVKG